jgi:hypothetical protein
VQILMFLGKPVFQILEEYCMFSFCAVQCCGQSDINLYPSLGDTCTHC